MFLDLEAPQGGPPRLPDGPHDLRAPAAALRPKGGRLRGRPGRRHGDERLRGKGFGPAPGAAGGLPHLPLATT